jgi:hypothetical protein
MASNVEWLQKRVEHYRANKNDMCEAIEEMKDLDKFGPILCWSILKKKLILEMASLIGQLL